MKYLYLFSILLSCLNAQSVNPPIEAILRGANGTDAKLTIIAIWQEGFHARSPSFQKPIYVEWSKIDLDWLKSERSDIEKKRVVAKPTPPPLDMKEMQVKLDEIKKGFRAAKTLRVTSGTAKNPVAEDYFRLIRSLRVETITQELGMIEAKLEKDIIVWKEETNSRIARYNLSWGQYTFRGFLNELHAFQEYVDAPYAGYPKPKKIQYTDPFSGQHENWFEE
jgi:hypothetical protein